MIPPQLLIRGYEIGIFPMAGEEGAISWYSPDPRAIVPLDRPNIPRSTRQLQRKGTFRIEIDKRFEEVMRGCADREETWISEEIIRSYVKLHEMGLAHSVESISSDGLAGGLYGVSIGSAFFGESMFSRETGGSKVALAFLIDHLGTRGYTLLDVQYTTPHLKMFGAVEIPRSEYLEMLADALKRSASFL